MTQFTYTTPEARIGKLKGEILRHAMPLEVLGMTGMQKRMPKNQSDTVVFRRWLPYGGTTTSANTINRWVVTATAHQISEGVTPTADSLTPQDTTAVMLQYGAMYQYTDKTADLYEDDVPPEMKKQVGERLGLVRELVRYAAYKAGTNAFYAGGTTRATTDEKISLKLLRRVARNLQSNHAKEITGVLAASANYATTPVEAGYVVYVHTDASSDVRDLQGFKHVSEYGQRKPISPRELGSVDEFRFITSPELASYEDVGGINTALYATTSSASNIDVYPFIVVGEDAWGQVALRGVDSMDAWHIPTGQRDKSDPGGQRGYVGALYWHVAVILNQGWMAVIEAGITDLAV